MVSLFYFGKVTPESKDLLIFIAILCSTLKLCILAHLHSVKVTWKQHNIGVFFYYLAWEIKSGVNWTCMTNICSCWAQGVNCHLNERRKCPATAVCKTREECLERFLLLYPTPYFICVSGIKKSLRYFHVSLPLFVVPW